MQNISYSTRYSIVKELCNKQSAKQFVGLIDVEQHTVRDRKPHEH